MKAEINQNGSLGFYDPKLHTQIPDSAIDISDADYHAHISGDLRQRVGEQWVSYTPPGPTLDDLKLAKHANILTDYESAISTITNAYPQSEIDTWSTQEAEAIAYQADPAADVPFLTSQALARGITVADLATLIVTKAAAYKLAVGTALGKRQSLDEQIDAAPSSAELDVIIW
ncbi:MAG: hypothetical protein M3H12_00155 [Chromatiales bacterium]|nr:hypothetical protein [Gammaproteobacteria bacterium]